MSDLDRLRDLKYHARRVLRNLYIGIENTTVHKEIERYKVGEWKVPSQTEIAKTFILQKVSLYATLNTPWKICIHKLYADNDNQ